MKLDNESMSILKNFAIINSSILFKPGKVQKTVSGGKAGGIPVEKVVLAEAEFPIEFPKECAIYDLPQFLNLVSVLGEVDITFKEDHLILKNKSRETPYRYCSPNLVVSPNDTSNLKEMMDDSQVTFDLSYEDLVETIKVASILDLNELMIEGKNGKLVATAIDSENDLSNSSSVELSSYDGSDFKGIFNLSYLQFIPGNYKVSVVGDSSEKLGFARFAGEKVTYHVAMNNFEE